MELASAATTDRRLRDMVARVQRLHHRIVASSVTLTENDDVVLCDTTSGSIVLTLPAASVVPGKVFTAKKMVAVNTLTFDAAGSDTIDGAGTLAWTTQYQTYTIAAVLTAAPATFSWIVI